MQWTKTSITLKKCCRKLSFTCTKYFLFIMPLNRTCFPQVPEHSVISWWSLILYFLNTWWAAFIQAKQKRSTRDEPDLQSKCSLLKSYKRWTQRCRAEKSSSWKPATRKRENPADGERRNGGKSLTNLSQLWQILDGEGWNSSSDHAFPLVFLSLLNNATNTKAGEILLGKSMFLR